MQEEKSEGFFITSSFALCGYLELKGLKYNKAEITKGKRGELKVDFYFLDPQGKGRDLEIEFRHSDEKKYKDSLFFYRNIINELLDK